MPQISTRPLRGLRALAEALAGFGALACYTQPPAVPPAPIVFRWPEPAFDPVRQCRGEYAQADLERYLQRARLALDLPSTVSVDLDHRRGCVSIAVQDVETGRLVELVLRGVAVPRRAVLLELSEPILPGQGRAGVGDSVAVQASYEKLL